MLYTIFGCRWLGDHLMRTYMVTYSILFIQSRLAVTVVGFLSGLLEGWGGGRCMNQHYWRGEMSDYFVSILQQKESEF